MENKLTDDEIISVVQAHKEGKKIEWRHYDRKGNPTAWYAPIEGRYPNWDFAFYEYRVAPEPRKPREFCAPIHNLSSIDAYDSSKSYYGGEVIKLREIIE